MADLKTNIGKVEIRDDALDDWELLEALREVDKGSTGAIVDVAPLLFGESEFNRIKDKIRAKHGKVLASEVTQIVRDALESLKTLKNSLPSQE